jgi:hypothetical protein
MVYTACIDEQVTNDRNPEASKHHKCSNTFEQLDLAKKFVIDYLIHIIEEGLRINFYGLDFSKSEFVPLFERDKYNNWRLKDRHRDDLNGVSMLYNALYLPSFHQRVVTWTIESDDPNEATEYNLDEFTDDSDLPLT